MAENLGRKLNLEFQSTKELVEKLREVDYMAIVDAETPLFEIGTPWGLRPLDFSPTADIASFENEKFLNKFPGNIFLSKNFRKIPMMIGSPSLERMLVAQTEFETELPGFIPGASSSLVTQRMTKMWTNFAKFGHKLILRIFKFLKFT